MRRVLGHHVSQFSRAGASLRDVCIRSLGTGTSYDFQAETSKLLDIVTNSIYTDKEVFLRELVSNCSDALEKSRHLQNAGEKIVDGERKLEIRVTGDEEGKVLIIEDSGVGMTKQEMIDNLGTIARSGSKAFVDDVSKSNESTSSNIIGQFGVGFYSAFMVASEIQVFSRSALDAENKVHCWSSEGSGKFELDQVEEDLGVGTRIRLKLKEDALDYASEKRLKEVIEKYSNFVSFPIVLNGSETNTVSALWTRDKKDITEEEYTEFYKFHSRAFDQPTYKVHFKTDAPIDMKALVFVPSWHSEHAGMGRMEAGVSLYSRKVLLSSNSDKILPSWMRFVKGVVDSDDLPLSLSRETMQDSRLLANMKQVLSKKIIKELQEQAKKDAECFNKFSNEFGNFLKEGVCTDATNQMEIAKLLRFNSSAVEKDQVVSFDEYISRSPPDQNKIYYLSAPTRDLAEASPYYEVFKAKGIEVLFFYGTLDDFVASNLRTYGGRSFVSAESGDLDEKPKEKEEEKEKDVEMVALTEWMEQSLKDHVTKVITTDRLKDSPAIVVDHEAASLRRMMKLMDQGREGAPSQTLGKQSLEINPTHPIILKVNELRKTSPELGLMVARQVYDNALMGAGLVDDPRTMLPRLNKVLEKLLH